MKLFWSHYFLKFVLKMLAILSLNIFQLISSVPFLPWTNLLAPLNKSEKLEKLRSHSLFKMKMIKKMTMIVCFDIFHLSNYPWSRKRIPIQLNIPVIVCEVRSFIFHLLFYPVFRYHSLIFSSQDEDD